MTVLTSLRWLDNFRASVNATDVSRQEGSNVDIVASPDGAGNGELALCHLSGLIPFTLGDNVAWMPAFEDAASVALAAHHLNVGDGSIVPEVKGLNERCKIRFTIEFADTQLDGGTSLKTIVDQTNREPDTSERLPCAFLGAYMSDISIATSIVTGLLGYPQISGASTSANLDDPGQYPLFGRSIPSDHGNAVPIIIYMRNVLNIQHLAVINTNNAYGNAYVDGLRQAADIHAPDMIIHQIPMDTSKNAVKTAVESLKRTEYRFVFALVQGTETHDALMTEAFHQGVAGNGKHHWLYGDSFLGTLDDRKFEKDSPLQKAYSGVGLLEVTGGVKGATPDYDNYVSKVSELKNSADLEYLGSLFPKYNYTNYGKTTPFIDDEDFLSSITSSYASFMYEATIALGLAACDSSSAGLSFSGQDHFDSLLRTKFTSMSGNVIFNEETGTRDPNSALYKVTNWVGTDDIDADNGRPVVEFKPVVTNFFQDAEWSQLEEFIFNDGTSNLPADLPDPMFDDATTLGLAVGLPVAAVLIMGVIIFLFYEHKRKQNDSIWKVKKSEMKFSEPPEVIGSGSFGLVLLAEYRGTQVAVKRVITANSEKKNPRDAGKTSKAGSFSTLASFRGDGTSSWGGMGLESGSGNGSAMMSRSTSRSGGFKSVLNSVLNTKGTVDPARKRKQTKQEFVEEMRYLSKLRHPCVTTVMGAVVDKGVEPMLVMEYMEHGSLYDLLHNETLVIEGELLLPILRDITQGMRFLHSANPQVIHGDLKAQNVLVDRKFRAKVADFGLSQRKTKGGTGTPFWMAPELLRRESTNTAKTDVYSFGIILYEVYSRKDPYERENPADVLRLVADKSVRKRPLVPKNMPPQIKSLMADCIEEGTEKRPTFEEIDIRVKRVDEAVDPGQGKGTTAISLFDIFPRHIAEALRDGRTVEPEHRDSVTIFFCDIVGFTEISSALAPMKVANMLDRLYTKFDALSRKHEVFKVETIGDAYMAVTNLVKNQSRDHAKRIAEFAIDAIKAANETYIDPEDESKGMVAIRVGFHSGSVVADVVGTRNPRYCLFGDSVNVASRMESKSKANRIHCSNAAADLLKIQYPELSLEPRGLIKIKGKGAMQTFWVNGSSKTNDGNTTKKEVKRSLNVNSSIEYRAELKKMFSPMQPVAEANESQEPAEAEIEAPPAQEHDLRKMRTEIQNKRIMNAKARLAEYKQTHQG